MEEDVSVVVFLEICKKRGVKYMCKSKRQISKLKELCINNKRYRLQP